MAQLRLLAKIIISAKLKVGTGLHIGTSGDYAPIGGVDCPFIRNPFTKLPIIPGSSVKGKMRTLLAKVRQHKKGSYFLPKHEKDEDVVKRLFGSAPQSRYDSKNDDSNKESVSANPRHENDSQETPAKGDGNKESMPSRLQFFDSFVTKDSINKFSSLETDTYFGEVKAENSIDRISGVANPRFIERVPAGMVFDFRLVYNLEKVDEYKADMDELVKGFRLLQMDYLGGHGSRGYGRVSFSDFKVKWIDVATGENIEESKLVDKLKDIVELESVNKLKDIKELKLVDKLKNEASEIFSY